MMTKVGIPFAMADSLPWGQLLCVLGQGLKPEGWWPSYDVNFTLGSGSPPGYEMSCTGNLGQEDLRKRLRQPLVQACRA